MHKIIFTLIFAFSFGIVSSQPISETEKRYTTAKLWGFLKYYHPEVASGKRNWDKELFETIEKTASAKDKKELSSIYLTWIESLGPVTICKKCDKPSKKNYLDKNFDLS